MRLTDGTDGHDMGTVKRERDEKEKNKRVIPLKALSSLLLRISYCKSKRFLTVFVANKNDKYEIFLSTL